VISTIPATAAQATTSAMAFMVLVLGVENSLPKEFGRWMPSSLVELAKMAAGARLARAQRAQPCGLRLRRPGRAAALPHVRLRFQRTMVRDPMAPAQTVALRARSFTAPRNLPMAAGRWCDGSIGARVRTVCRDSKPLDNWYHKKDRDT